MFSDALGQLYDRLFDDSPSRGSGGLSTAPIDYQELSITVANRGVQSPVHVQFPRIVNITVVNTDAANVLTINILDGRSQKSYSIGAANSVIFKKVTAQSFWFTGNAATVFSYAASWPQETDPNTLAAQTALTVTVSGTVKTDLGQGTNIANPTVVPSGGDLTSGAALVKTAIPQTLAEEEFLAPTAVIESTAETVAVAGTVVLALGQVVQYELAAAQIVAVAAGVLVVQYIALKGHTTGKYYAICYAGGTGVSGSFAMTDLEKIDVVYRNSSAVTGINVGGFWKAVSP